MANHDKATTASADKVQQVKNTPPVAEIQGGVEDVMGDVALRHDSMDSQVAMLKRLNGVQRQSALTQIGRTQGNRYVQRLVTAMRTDVPTPESSPSPSVTLPTPTESQARRTPEEPGEPLRQEGKPESGSATRTDESFAPPLPPGEPGAKREPKSEGPEKTEPVKAEGKGTPGEQGQIVATTEEAPPEARGERPEEAARPGEIAIEEGRAAKEKLVGVQAKTQTLEQEGQEGERALPKEPPQAEALTKTVEGTAMTDTARQVGAQGKEALQGQQAEAEGRLQTANDTLGQAEAAVADMRSAQVNFGLPELGEDEATAGEAEVLQRRAIPENEAERRALMEQRRAMANSLVNNFLGNVAGRAEQLARLGDEIAGPIQAAAETAKGRVAAEIEQQKALVSTGIGQARSQVETKAQGLRAHVQAEYQTTSSTIKQSSTAARTTVTTEYNNALTTLAGLERTQLSQVETLFAQGDASYRAAGSRVAGEAQALGSAREAAYRGRVRDPKVDDSFLDGPVTDNRNEARADAAKEVTAKYKESLVAQAQEQANSAKAGKAQVIQQIRDTVNQYRDALKNHHKTTIDSLTGSEKQATLQAGQMKGSLLQSVDQGVKATMKSLQDQERAQLQILEEQGQQRLQAIDTMAQQATASLQQAVGAAVASFATGQQNFLNSVRGLEAPDPTVLGPALDNALAQIDASVATSSAQIYQQIAAAQTSLDSAAEQASNTLTSIGQNALAGVTSTQQGFDTSIVQLKAATKTGFQQITETHTKTTDSTTTAATEGFQKTLGDVRTAFTQLNTGIQSTFTNSISKLEMGLRDALHGRVSGVKGLSALIDQEAEKAAAQVQPRWKTIVKWVLIIAVIVVAAFVLGPFLVGALGAVLGSTLGTIVAGAIVGGLANAAVQVINNWHDGKKLFGMDVLVSFGVGALGGALGAGIGLGVQTAIKAAGSQFMQAGLSHYIGRSMLDWGSSVLTDFIINGKVTWESVGIALLQAVLQTTATKVPGLGRTATRFEGMGTQVGQGINTRFGWGGGTSIAPTVTVPTPTVETPTAKVETPTTTVETPTTKVETPTVDTPGPKVETPTTTVETPTVDTPGPKVEVETPTTKVETPAPTVDVPSSGPKQSQGAKMAQDLGYPAAPEGYHWAKSGDDVILRRNPGMAETLPRLTYDPKAGTFVAENASIGHRHFTGNPHEGVQRASAFLKELGVPRQYRKQILESFEIETITVRQAGPNEYGTRYYDGVNAHAKGRYVFESLPAGRQDLALPPEWNQMSNVQQWQIRSGTTLIEGRVGPQGPQYPGGNIQKYIPNPDADLIPVNPQ